LEFKYIVYFIYRSKVWGQYFFNYLIHAIIQYSSTVNVTKDVYLK